MKYLFLWIALTFSLVLHAQFTAKLDLEIAELAAKKQLDGIAKDDYFTTLKELANQNVEAELNNYLQGAWWRYSHSVYPDRKEVRLSNARGILKFLNSEDAYYIKRNEKDTVWCDWNFDEGRLLLSRYADKSKTDQPMVEPFGVHSISEKRLVLLALARSKAYPGKYRSIFHVYFRR
ncbi:hypothetical protein [Marinoscillum furvescens]|uniref:Uncharacterized protein n=1 Tax=Marinoscillum furvescens DSM 4134 TaxID=1122208 RepID=A0A3D9L5T8_MARFU|nr:hypothetical protein [Marinoscillum furvescens]REE01289.1 hypothetical protein C7460_104309 [Marinoscillum furvescens DSM 4134]